METEALQEDLLALLLWADRNAVRLTGLNATQASLHEVFLAFGGVVIPLSTVELRLLLRRRITAFSVVVVPLGLAALTLFGQRPDDPALWGRLLSTNFLLLTMLSAYLVSLTVFTARRQSRVLKRLRTSEAVRHGDPRRGGGTGSRRRPRTSCSAWSPGPRCRRTPSRSWRAWCWGWSRTPVSRGRWRRPS